MQYLHWRKKKDLFRSNVDVYIVSAIAHLVPLHWTPMGYCPHGRTGEQSSQARQVCEAKDKLFNSPYSSRKVRRNDIRQAHLFEYNIHLNQSNTLVYI